MTLADFISTNNSLGLSPAPAPRSAYSNIVDPAGLRVLGASTSANTTAPSAPKAPTGGGAGSGIVTTPPSGQLSQPDGSQQVRNEINGAYDGYISSLDQQLGILGGSFDSMSKGVQASTDQFQNTLDLQKTQGIDALTAEKAKLDATQKKTLQGLAEDVTNQFQAGNVYLGARGAGDSSAANQYAYAIAKQGNKQRGDVMAQTADITNQINLRKENLTKIYDNETKNNKLEYQKQMSSLAQWYADAQSQIAGLKGTANLNRGTSLAQMSMDLLTQAKQRAQDIQDQATQRQSTLEAWALNHSNNLEQARAKLGDQSAFTAPAVTRGAIVGANAGTGSNSGSNPVAYGYGSATQDKNLTSLFA